MQLAPGKVAVVTGAASGIGLALAERWARGGLHVVLADVDERGLRAAAERVEAHGVQSAMVITDVSDEQSVNALAATAVERFGAVHLVCNNAGVASQADPWFGPLSSWRWVMGVNFWGVVHGVRAFLPTLAAQGEGHIVNTSSVAGLWPGFAPEYDASKHAVVALTEHLFKALKTAGLPIGVSVLCPGFVRTGIVDADRNWPAGLGAPPDPGPAMAVLKPLLKHAIDEGTTPAAVADIVAEAVSNDRFWIFTEQEFLEIAVRRWHQIAEGEDPELEVDMPGMPPASQVLADVRSILAAAQPDAGTKA